MESESPIKKFYDPHPGWAGAAAPIPGPVKKVADELNGQVIRIADAVRKIQAATGGRVEVDEKNHSILLWGGMHVWQVIRFKDPGVLGGGA